jgi:phospholipid N-methyltransferase
MLDMADLSSARLVVELGAGTGVYTREILRRIPDEARLLAFEVDEELVQPLSGRMADHRLRVVEDSAENVGEYLNGERADVVVSGLPFTSLPAEVKSRVLRESMKVLVPGGCMLVLQYSPFVRQDLSKLFTDVRLRISPLNVPPAFLFRCSMNGEP